jgi:hypothetical protein
MAAFAANGRLAKVQYRLEIIAEDGLATGRYLPPGHLALTDGDLRRHAVRFPDDLRFPPASGNAFRSSVLRQIFPVPESVYGKILADLYPLTLAPLFGEVASLESVGAYYRVHSKNNYFHRTVNLELTRQIITYTWHGHAYITQYAEQLGLQDRPLHSADILSVTYIANRLLSYRLEPQRHPIQGDSTADLVVLGFRAASRRFDLRLIAKVAYCAWFVAVALGPKRVSRFLGERYLVQQNPHPLVWKMVRRLLFVS